jgi:hypothetical protein
MFAYGRANAWASPQDLTCGPEINRSHDCNAGSDDTGRHSRSRTIRFIRPQSVDRPALTLADEHEALVALLGDLGANL